LIVGDYVDSVRRARLRRERQPRVPVRLKRGRSVALDLGSGGCTAHRPQSQLANVG
jgi:hypothetical protein